MVARLEDWVGRGEKVKEEVKEEVVAPTCRGLSAWSPC